MLCWFYPGSLVFPFSKKLAFSIRFGIRKLHETTPAGDVSFFSVNIINLFYLILAQISIGLLVVLSTTVAVLLPITLAQC